MPGFPRTTQSQPCCDWFVLLNEGHLREKCLDFPERISLNMVVTDSFCWAGAIWEKNVWISKNDSVATWLRLIRSAKQKPFGRKIHGFPRTTQSQPCCDWFFLLNGSFLRENPRANQSQHGCDWCVLHNGRFLREKMPGFPRTNQSQPCCDWFVLLNGSVLRKMFERKMPGFPRTNQLQPCCDWFILLNGRFLGEEVPGFPRTTQSQPCCD